MVSASYHPALHRTVSPLVELECRTTASCFLLHHGPLLAGKRPPRTPASDPSQGLTTDNLCLSMGIFRDFRKDF